MRKLETRDIFAGARIVAAVGVKEELKKMALSQKEKGKKAEDVGFDLIYTIFEKAAQVGVEYKIYEFLGNLFEVTPEEVASLDPCDCLDKIEEVATMKQWKDFFSRAVSLMQRN